MVAGLGVIVVVLLHLSKDGAEGSCWWHRLERKKGACLVCCLRWKTNGEKREQGACFTGMEGQRREQQRAAASSC